MNIMIVVNYNDYPTTETYLKQIKEYKALDKIIVVDNCSTDNSYELLERFNSLKIDVIASKANNGYASGNNFGIKYAEKNYKPQNIIISNPDIIVSEKTIKKICDHLNLNNEVAAVSGLIHDVNNKIASNFAWKLPSYGNIMIGTFLLSSKINNKYYDKDEVLKQDGVFFVDVLHGCFFAIKHQVMKDINYFDEDTFLYNEENILAHKLKQKGYKQLVLIDEKVMHYQGLSINKSITDWKVRSKIFEESRLVYLRNYLKVSKFKTILFKILFNIGEYEKYVLISLKRKLMRASQ